jgi:hypothetical protein
MNVRQRVIAALGGRCAWCQSTAGLEIDHMHGGGNQHRAQIRLPLATWLVREHTRLGSWPTGFQLLCQACHDRKSGRRPAMPPRKGATALNISLPDHLASQLAVLAAAPEHHNSKSQVLETALRAFLEGGANLTALDTVHQQLSTLGTSLGQQIQALDQTLHKARQNIL